LDVDIIIVTSLVNRASLFVYYSLHLA